MGGAVLDRLSPAVRLWLPVVVLPPILVADSLISAEGPDVTALGVLAAVVGCLPLVLRSRLGFVALAPLLVPGIILILWQLEPGSTVVLIPMVALYELATRSERRRNVWAALEVVQHHDRALLLHVTGENGVGKTRVLDEVIKQLAEEPGVAVLEGACVPYGEANVWFPLASALWNYLDLDPIPADVSIPAQGPTRPQNSGGGRGKGDTGGSGGSGGGGGGGGAAGGGGGMGMGMGPGGARREEEGA